MAAFVASPASVAVSTLVMASGVTKKSCQSFSSSVMGASAWSASFAAASAASSSGAGVSASSGSSVSDRFGSSPSYACSRSGAAVLSV